MLDLSKIPLNEYGHVQTFNNEPTQIVHRSNGGRYLCVSINEREFWTDHTGLGLGADRFRLLIPAPRMRKLTGWVNVYPPDANVAILIYDTKTSADQCATPARIACLDLSRFGIEFTEEEGLEKEKE